MVGLFTVILLAAIVGLIRPFFGWRRLIFGLIAFAAFVMIGVFAPKQPSTSSKPSPETGATSSTAPDGARPAPDASPAPESKWAYSEDKDEMRGTTTRFATLDSQNEVDLEFPYGTVKGKITVRHRPEDGLNIMFSVEKGQVLCHSFGDSYISAKFDNGPIERFSCTGTSDGSSETAFIEAASRFLGKLRASKRTVIEAEFFQKGRQQFVFETAGLQWK